MGEVTEQRVKYGLDRRSTWSFADLYLFSRCTTAESFNSLVLPACAKRLNTIPKPKILDGLKKGLSSVSYIPFGMSSYSCAHLIGCNFMMIVYLILSVRCFLLCHVNFTLWDTLFLHTNLGGTVYVFRGHVFLAVSVTPSATLYFWWKSSLYICTLLSIISYFCCNKLSI